MHLVDYEEAKGDKAKALAACEVVRYKNSKRLAWGWTETAIEHAADAGAVENVLYDIAGNGRYPNVDALEAEIKRQLQATP